MSSTDEMGFGETLEGVAETMQGDLRSLFSHEGAEVEVREGRPVRLVATGEEGSFSVTWPPSEGLTEASGRFGGHARVAFEFVLASGSPGAFFEGYRPQTERRRGVLFDRLEAYVEDSLAKNPYFSPLVVERRGPALLVFGDDEYVLVAEDGSYRGVGILEWKVKRLVAFALADADDLIFNEREPSEPGRGPLTG